MPMTAVVHPKASEAKGITKATIEFVKPNKLWVCLKRLNQRDPNLSLFCGVFPSVELAVSACTTDMHIVIPVAVGEVMEVNTANAPGAYYPKRSH